MRCVAYCTARQYRIDALGHYFRKQNALVTHYQDIVHITAGPIVGDLFIFSTGSMVCWGLQSASERRLLAESQVYAIAPFEPIEADHFIYRYCETTRYHTDSRFNVDIIELGNTDVALKLAISFALAQSVKLGSYEGSVQETIEKNRDIPHLLAKQGRIRLPGKLISQRIGEIFLARSTINLHSEYLDTPEYFWENPSGEEAYQEAKQFLDMDNRVHSLNQKLDVLQELLDMLNSQLQHRHSSMLEIIIILLILIEVIMNLIHWM